jgi:VCBS repeat-containing protein
VVDARDGMASPNFTIVGQPASGTVVVDPATGAWSYVPAADYFGTDSFTVAVTDDDGNTALQVVSLTVGGVNDAPVAAGTSVATTAAIPVNGRLPAALDVDGDPVRYGLAAAPSGGTVVVRPDGSYTYTPAAGFSGADSFIFTISDGVASSTYRVDVAVAPAGAPALVLPGYPESAGIAGATVPPVTGPSTPVAASVLTTITLPPGPMLGSTPFLMPSLADLNVLSTTPTDYALVRLGVDGPARVAMFGASSDILESLDRGFPAVRGPVESSVATLSGASLSVLNGVPNLAAADDGLNYTVPRDAFIHSDVRAVITLDARQADGQPLPDWIRFDGVSGLFNGRPAADAAMPRLNLEVVARDNAGREARTTFTIADVDRPRLDSDDGGFQVHRLSRAQLAAVRVGGQGELLVAYVPIRDISQRSGTALSLRVPGDAFAHSNPHAVVRLTARLANGQPLPEWLQFDGFSGQFGGTPPEGFAGTLDIHVTARDDQGLEAVTRFKLSVQRSAMRTAGGDERAALQPVKRAAPSFRDQLRSVRQPAGAEQVLLERALAPRASAK